MPEENIEKKKKPQGMYKLVSPKELSIFCKQISVLFNTQTTLMEGISILKDQTLNKHLRQTLGGIYEKMEYGDTFAEAIRSYDNVFPVYMMNMIYIGEASGTLNAVFDRMSEYYDKESKMRKKIKSAITYPAILTVLMAAIVVLLIVKILPMFEDILVGMGAELPAATSVILSFGAFLSSNAIIIMAVFVAIIVFFVVFSRTAASRAFKDMLKLKIPAIKFISLRTTTSRVARCFSILMRSGVQLLNAFDDIEVIINNKLMEAKFKEAVEKIKDGTEPDVAFTETGIFPPLFVKMFALGQKTGNLDEMMDKCASVFDEEADEAMERVTTMIEPVLVIFLSVVVGAILLSVILPMITIMNQIG